VRLQQRGWIEAEWGVPGNNRKAKFYAITAKGRKQLAADAAHGQRLAAVMGRVLALSPDGGTFRRAASSRCWLRYLRCSGSCLLRSESTE
jgi:predicted ArsR family transcriptional regulator